MSEFAWLPADNPMAAALQEKNWSQSLLGPVGQWPQRLRSAVDLILGCPQAMVVLWGNNLVQIYNGAFSALMGDRHPAELGIATKQCWPLIWQISEPFYDRVRGGESCSCKDQVLAIVAGGATARARFDLNYVPLRAQQGEVLGILVSICEASSRPGLLAERDALRARLEHSDETIRDMHYRMRNALGVVRSIVRRTAATSTSLEGMEMHLQGRIAAFTRVQAAIARTGARRGVSLASLVSDELSAQGGRPGETVVLEGPEIQLRPAAAELVGLAMHELACNAVKFGALTQPGGQVCVRWQRGPASASQGEDRLLLDWEESGCDLGTLHMGAPGFGTETLLNSLACELEARTFLRPAPAGMHFQLDAPLSRMEAVR
ncbi:hypothetical protein CA833_20830 [Novosphingobium sp. KA1]|nr:hypothetical protein CA833_20830 [Novosphingobium sp. KA1]